MFDLDTIVRMNAKASAPQAETETTRHCSFAKSRGGVVLHSAKQRATVFLDGARATRFLGKFARIDRAFVKGGRGFNSELDSLVEGHFE